MVKDSKKSSSAAKQVVVGVLTPPVTSSAAEKGTKLRRRRNPEKKKKKKKIVEEEEQVGKAHAVRADDDELEKQIVKLRKKLDSQDGKRDALEARASEAENKLQDYTLKLENLRKINDEQKNRIRKTERALQVAEEELMKVKSKVKELMEDMNMEDDDAPLEMEDADAPLEMKDDDNVPLHIFEMPLQKRFLPEDSKTLYATNLDHPKGRKLVEADFEEFFREVGKVVNVQIQLDPKNIKIVDFAKIEFESHDVAVEAMKMHGRLFVRSCIQLNGEPKLKIPRYNKHDCTNERPIISCFGFGKAISVCKLKSELKNYFSIVGEVAKVYAPVDLKTSLPVGRGYVVFKNEESFYKAFDLNGALFLGYPLQVRRAKVFVTSN